MKSLLSEKQGVGSSILPLATGFFPSVYKTGTITGTSLNQNIV